MITFLLLPLYTGILSTEEYGVVDLMNSLTSLLIPIVTLKVEEAIFRNMVENRSNYNKEKEVISNGIFLILIQIIIFSCIFAISYPLIHNEYKIYLFFNVIAYIFSSVFLQIARGFGNNSKYALGSFLGAFFTIVFNILFIVLMRLGAQGMLLGMMIGQSLCSIFLVISLRIYRYLDFKLIKRNLFQKLMKYAIPLVPNAISWWVFNVSDRTIVSMFLGLSKNGILAASSKFSSAFTTIYYVFHTSWTESVMMHFKDEDFVDFFNKTFNRVIGFFTSMAFGVIACMPIIFPIMINANYSEGYNLVPILMLGALFNAIVALMSSIYLANKNTKTIANISFISAVINIITHLLLLRFIGLYAAAISTFIAFFCMTINRLRDIEKRYFKIIIDKKLIISSISVLALILVFYYLNNNVFNIISICLAVIFAIIINKDIIKFILYRIKKVLINRKG